MRNRIELPNIDYEKVNGTLVQATRTAGRFVKDHTPEIFIGAFSFVTVDNIRVRLGRKKDLKSFENNAIKQQTVIRKHEAEINVLKETAAQAQRAQQKVDQLEEIVRNLTEEGAAE